ncbi:DUF4191 domain-containing protein [Lipingzhangella sp. LS1_29]|uniref:DUF4191 domain-containing protein n=1 Tax=Lipingzhangella rawalii TaxID=2055835 RepID=A0ABU2H2I8_9ACTN|nr:DUF4191 domain-containing protein [Lipingzhangella rawalii]MDS1269506.1 DUF4191 domain-containing protein [Lipingzhangella rawalii]
MAKQSKDTKTGSAQTGEKKPGRLKQIGMIARMLHRHNKKSIPLAVLVAVVVLGLAVLGGILTGAVLWWTLMGVPIAVLAGFIVFSRSAQRMQYTMMEGHLGAGGMILDNMRGNWSVSLGVNANRSMDVVHRVVGRPGVVLVGEGDPARLKQLLLTEKKRVSRVAHNTPIYELQAGTGAGQIPISQLQRKLFKLPRNLNKAEVTELNYRLKAMPPPVQMPKGPMPKGAKMPKMPTPKEQGGQS